MMQYKNLKRLREENEISQAHLARILHCTQRAYSYYETGERDIPTSILIALAKYYHVSVDFILGISDERN